MAVTSRERNGGKLGADPQIGSKPWRQEYFKLEERRSKVEALQANLAEGEVGG